MTGKDKILAAAKAVIMQKGIDGATVREIAKEAGLTTGAIYHHYKNKEAILYDVLNSEYSITNHITRLFNKGDISPRELLNTICTQIDQRMNNRLEQRLRFYLSHEAALGNAEIKSKLTEAYLQWTDGAANLFSPAFNIEESEKARSAAIIMIAALEGISSMQIAETLPFTSHEIAEIYKDFFSYTIPRYLEKRE